jgi:hypothetical protein
VPPAHAPPWMRFLPDPVAVRRDEVERLQALGVTVSEVGRRASMGLFERFVREFVPPEDGARLHAEVKRRAAWGGALGLERWLRPDCTLLASAKGGMLWLARGDGAARCIRFERRPQMPALEIGLTTMDDAWAGLWPGAFVSFVAARALVVTLDYEVFRCDLRGGHATPYR